MEPLDDRELNDLLPRWQAPPTPPGLRDRVFAARRRRRLLWLLPPAACLALVLYLRGPRPAPAPRVFLTFRDLQPVRELRPRILRGSHDTN
jgi:hypothetical protein